MRNALAVLVAVLVMATAVPAKTVSGSTTVQEPPRPICAPMEGIAVAPNASRVVIVSPTYSIIVEAPDPYRVDAAETISCTDYPGKMADAQTQACSADCPGCLCQVCKVVPRGRKRGSAAWVTWDPGD